MKKIDLIHSLKQFCIVGAVTAGIFTVSIHNSSALTEDEILPEEPILSSEAEVPASDTPAEEPGTTDTPSEEAGPTDATDAPSGETGSTDATDTPSGATGSTDSTDTPSGATGSTDATNTPSGATGSTNTTDTPSGATGSTNTTDTPSGATGSTDATDTPSEDVSAQKPAVPSETPGTTPGINPDTNTETTPGTSPDTDTEATPDAAPDASTETTPDAAPDATTETPSEDEKPEPNLSHQENVSVKPEQQINDTKNDAVYFQPNFVPSGSFIDDKDKIKYNVALPLDNIPSFITQEMIIGALKCQDETGYPASVTIAQIIQESGFGKYGPGGKERQGLSYLAFQYCNLFGIKGTGPAGSVNMRTGEQAPSGAHYTINAGFRVYNTYTECIEDRTDILKRVYKDLTAGVTDANTFAMKIGSRWATSHRYGQHLITQMERYDLYRLDEMTLQDFSKMIGRFAEPCPGSYKTSDFGYREFDHKFHKGIDLGTHGESVPTYAADAGTVIIAGYNASAGNWVVIDHGNGLVTKYMHHEKIFVVQGQEVEKGQQIGLTGNTGNSFGVHLHFQVEENGVAVNPETYLYPEQAE